MTPAMTLSSRFARQKMIDPKLEELFHSSPHSGETMKKAILASLLFILILIWMPLPYLTSKTILNPTQKKPRPVHHQLRIRPEEVQPQQGLIRKKAHKFPLPDPTPLETEPCTRTVEFEQPSIVETGNFDVFVPELPQSVEAPLSPTTLGLEMPVVIKRISPNYPVKGLKMGLQGYILVEAVLGKDGKVRDARIIRTIGRGNFGFEEQALMAVRQWHFLPGLLRGKPVDVRMNLRIDFRITR